MTSLDKWNPRKSKNFLEPSMILLKTGPLKYIYLPILVKLNFCHTCMSAYEFMFPTQTLISLKINFIFSQNWFFGETAQHCTDLLPQLHYQPVDFHQLFQSIKLKPRSTWFFATATETAISQNCLKVYRHARNQKKFSGVYNAKHIQSW